MPYSHEGGAYLLQQKLSVGQFVYCFLTHIQRRLQCTCTSKGWYFHASCVGGGIVRFKTIPILFDSDEMIPILLTKVFVKKKHVFELHPYEISLYCQCIVIVLAVCFQYLASLLVAYCQT